MCSREQKDGIKSHLVLNGIMDSSTAGNQNVTQKEEGRQQKSTRKIRRSVFLWTNAEVMRWLRKYHTQYHSLYNHVFVDHDISGKSLVRLNHMKMEKMGITDVDHRSDLLEHVLKLRLKHELNELKLLQKSEQEQ